LPLDAERKAGGRNVLLDLFGLPVDFEVDGFENLVPACARCNRRKSDTLLAPSRAFLLALSAARVKATLAIRTAETMTKDADKAPLLAKVEAAVSAGDITKEEIQQLLEGLPVYIQKAADLPAEQLLIAPGWTIVQRRFDLAVLRSPSGTTGVTTLAKEPHSSWFCPSCGQLGPWDGVVCRSCGSRSEPDM
jgi:hypothetical protein